MTDQIVEGICGATDTTDAGELAVCEREEGHDGWHNAAMSQNTDITLTVGEQPIPATSYWTWPQGFSEAHLAKAEGVLNIAMMRLQGESPADVYTSDGYHIWLRAVVGEIAKALVDES